MVAETNGTIALLIEKCGPRGIVLLHISFDVLLAIQFDYQALPRGVRSRKYGQIGCWRRN
jgi:hypothetical protein